jgi:hypothetical protein
MIAAINPIVEAKNINHHKPVFFFCVSIQLDFGENKAK